MHEKVTVRVTVCDGKKSESKAKNLPFYEKLGVDFALQLHSPLALSRPCTCHGQEASVGINPL